LKGGGIVLGFGDIGIFLAYTLCILSAICCIVYGIFNWNKGNDLDEKDQKKDTDWKQKEQELGEKLDI
jgi:hypothetical protein